jgi:hypothetical protein
MLVPPDVFDMVTARNARELALSVIRYGQAVDLDFRFTSQGFNFPDQHGGLKVPVVIVKPGSKIRDFIGFSAGGLDIGFEDIGVFHVGLPGGKSSILRQYRKFASFFFVQHTAKQKITVKARHAEPTDVGVFFNVCDKTAVTYQAGTVCVFFHGKAGYVSKRYLSHTF